MPKREAAILIADILDACNKIGRYTKGLSHDDFLNDEKTIDAVIHNLTVIGEAAQRMPESDRARYSDVQWHQIACLPKHIVHDYAGVDVEIVWQVISESIPELKTQLGHGHYDHSTTPPTQAPSPALADLIMAFESQSMHELEPIGVYVSKSNGTVVYDDESLTGEPCPVEDIDENDDYLALPDKYDFDLGQRLVWRFIRQRIPDHEDYVRGLFKGRGAYGRYKDFLSQHDLLDEWFTFEAEASKQALLDWCEVNQIPIRN